MIDNNLDLINVPRKWKKHMVLVDWKLREREDLYNTINRYPISQYEQCLQDINEDITSAATTYVYIIKLVYREKFQKLPNIIITSAHDIEIAKNQLTQMNLNKYMEIWYCKNENNKMQNLFGRVLFGNDELFPRYCPLRIEIVVSSSARSIEKYPLLKEPFAAMYKASWNSPAVFRELITNGMMAEELQNISLRIVRLLSAYVSEINDFGEFAFSCGCNRLCLEFVYKNNEISFIDWDSDNDERVIAASDLK